MLLIICFLSKVFLFLFSDSIRGSSTISTLTPSAPSPSLYVFFFEIIIYLLLIFIFIHFTVKSSLFFHFPYLYWNWSFVILSSLEIRSHMSHYYNKNSITSGSLGFDRCTSIGCMYTPRSPNFALSNPPPLAPSNTLRSAPVLNNHNQKYFCNV